MIKRMIIIVIRIHIKISLQSIVFSPLHGKYYILYKFNELMKKRLKNYDSEKRPWGGFERFTLNEKTTVKVLTIKPKKRLSLQYHKYRSEFWRVLDGPVKVTVGDKIFTLKKGEEITVPKGAKHRIEGLSKPARVLEISFGKFIERDDIRLEDDYGRRSRRLNK